MRSMLKLVVLYTIQETGYKRQIRRVKENPGKSRYSEEYYPEIKERENSMRRILGFSENKTG